LQLEEPPHGHPDAVQTALISGSRALVELAQEGFERGVSSKAGRRQPDMERKRRKTWEEKRNRADGTPMSGTSSRRTP
jgi:hypothetical protein